MHVWIVWADLHVQSVDDELLPGSIVICGGSTPGTQLCDYGVVIAQIRFPHTVKGPCHPVMVEHLLEDAPPWMQHLESAIKHVSYSHEGAFLPELLFQQQEYVCDAMHTMALLHDYNAVDGSSQGARLCAKSADRNGPWH